MRPAPPHPAPRLFITHMSPRSQYDAAYPIVMDTGHHTSRTPYAQAITASCCVRPGCKRSPCSSPRTGVIATAVRCCWCAGENLLQPNVYAQVSPACLSDSMIETNSSSFPVTSRANDVPCAGSGARLLWQQAVALQTPRHADDEQTRQPIQYVMARLKRRAATGLSAG